MPLLLALALLATPPAAEPQVSGTTARLRGVSAVSATVAWASGTGGTVLKTVDGGKTWTPQPVPGAEKLDFRDIEAFSALDATVLSIGPGEASRIYRTKDGGTTWTLQFTNPDPRAFYDALAFWTPQRGLAMSDPVDGRFRLLATEDGGATWKVLEPRMPEVLKDESAFAASGTCLVTGPSGRALLLSGGAGRGRVFRTEDGGRTWAVVSTEMEADQPSAGLFGGLMVDGRRGFAVGGDYRKEDSPSRLLATDDGGKTWRTAATLRGFRSAITIFQDGTLLAVGPQGCDLSRDHGRTWEALPSQGLHAASAQDGVAWAVGEQGRIVKISAGKKD